MAGGNQTDGAAPQTSPWRRRVFATAMLTQIAIQGAIGAFPLWLTQFKRIFNIDQAQANVVGIALYASVQLVGVPAGGFVVGWGSATSITAVFVMMTFIGYGLLYFVATGALGHAMSAFVALVTGIVLIMVAVGILFSVYFSVMTQSDMYGGDQTVFVSGIVNSLLAVGAVASSCLFMYTGLGLQENLLLIWSVQAAAWPLVTLCVYIATKPGVEVTTAAREDSSETISDLTPLLRAPSLNDDRDPPLRRDQLDEEPAACGDYIVASLSTWRYYHAVLIMVLKVGIGSTFTTNLGSAVTATLSQTATEDYVDNKIATTVLCLNIGQLLGRLVFTSFALCGGNPNVTTVASVCLVAVGYAACFAARVFLACEYENIVWITSFFGFFYGAMWATSGGMYRLAPYSERPERAFAVIQPPAAFSTLALNTFAGVMYDRHASKDHTCFGHECYRDSDIVLAAMSGLLFLTAAWRLLLGVPDKDGRWCE